MVIFIAQPLNKICHHEKILLIPITSFSAHLYLVASETTIFISFTNYRPGGKSGLWKVLPAKPSDIKSDMWSIKKKPNT